MNSQIINPLKMRRSAMLLRSIFAEIEQLIQPGISTKDIDFVVQGLIVEGNGVSATVGYHPYGAPWPFSGACCTSVNSTLAHGVPNYDEILNDGDIVSVDIALSLDGHFADACRTYAVGDVSPELLKLIEASENLTYSICEFIGMNVGIVTTADIGAYTEHWARELGYHVLPDFGGHGIGHVMHSTPFIPVNERSGNGTIIKPGMYITVEPILLLEPTPTSMANDGWSIYSPTGVISAQTEHTLMVRENDIEILI